MNQVKNALAPKDGEFGIAFEWADAQVGRDLDVLISVRMCVYFMQQSTQKGSKRVIRYVTVTDTFCE